MKNTKNGEILCRWGFFLKKSGEKNEKLGEILKGWKKYSVNREKYLEFSKNWENSGGKKTPKIMENAKKMEKILQKIRKDTPPKPKIPESKPLFQLW